METTPRPPDVTASADTGSGVVAYLEVLRKEQVRFLDAIGEARSFFCGSGKMAQVTVTQAQLTRRFLDAQRSILRHRASVEAEVALVATGGDFDAGASDGADASRQLSALLDDWWLAENQSGRTMIDAARAHAELCHPVAETSGAQSSETTPAGQLPSDVVAALDAADPADLGLLLTTLDDLLKPRSAVEARHKAQSVDDEVIIRFAPVPIGLQPMGASWSC